MNDEDERIFYAAYLETLRRTFGENSKVYREAWNDPAGDNYHFFRGSDYDALETPVLERYKQYNGTEGNSPTADMSPESYPTAATTLPDVEDINRSFFPLSPGTPAGENESRRKFYHQHNDL